MPIKKTPSVDYPQAVIRQIELLAQNIVVARKRRKETQAQWAKRLGVSQPTMARIERGDPSVAMASYVMCMWLIQPDCALANLIAPQHDTVALEREITEALPRRAPRGSPSPEKPKARPANLRGKPANGMSVVPTTADSNSAAQTPIASVGDSPNSALVEAAKRVGYGSVADLAQSLSNDSLAAQAAKIKDQFLASTTLVEEAKRMGYGSVAELVQGMTSPLTPATVGLAALMGKAQGRSQ